MTGRDSAADGRLFVILGGGATSGTPDIDGEGNLYGPAANRLLTAALLHGSGFGPVRSCITPASAALPSVFSRVVNALGE